MARPAKVVDVHAGHDTKKDISTRIEIENGFKGEGSVVPPVFLTEKQRIIFDNIVNVLKDYLGELDSYVVADAAITIDRLQYIDEQINLNPSILLDKDTATIRKNYEAGFFRLCNELCLSPQARAKIGSLATARRKEESDPLLQLLKGAEGS